MADDWRTPEKRQMIVRKIAETVQQYPDVLNRNPSEIEEAIFSKVNDKDQYMNTIGKVLLSIKHKGHQLMNSNAAGGMMGSSHMGGGGGGGGMMGYQPGVHHDPNYHPHSGMHLRAPHPSMGMNPGMGGHHHNMMNGPAQPGYTRMSMMHGPHGGQMMPGMGGPHHPHQMMGMGGPAPPHRGMNPGMMYAGNRMPPMTGGGMGGGGMGGGGMGGGGMVPRMLPNANPQPPSDGVQAVTALPNPSFYTESSTNNNPSVNPNYSTGTASQPQNQQMHPPTMNPQQTVAPPTMQQAPSPAPPKTVNVPSPRTVPMPSPSTPWNPNSPAHAVPSPNQQAHPEANAAVLSKLQELQPYVPLLARMMDRIEKGHQGEKTKNEQWVKLNSLYNVIQSKNIKVPLQTLEKCHTALDGLFKKDSSVSAPSPAPPISLTGIPSPAVSNSQQPKPPNPPSLKSQQPVSPQITLPASPPVASPSRNLHDFVSIASPCPLSSALQPTFCPEEDPLDRLPPEKRAKLDEQASRSFLLALKREILRLRGFHIKEVPGEGSEKDGSIFLKCCLVPDELPEVPPLLVRVARDYPFTSPECLIPEYQTDSCSEFSKKVGQLLINQLSSCEFKYSVSHILEAWKDSVLENVSREIEDVNNYALKLL